jgi:hypothetical protein
MHPPLFRPHPDCQAVTLTAPLLTHFSHLSYLLVPFLHHHLSQLSFLQLIQALVVCHNQNPYGQSLSHFLLSVFLFFSPSVGKFIGFCNLEKVAIDQCFAEEKKLKLKTNRLKRKDDGFQEYLAEWKKNKSSEKE